MRFQSCYASALAATAFLQGAQATVTTTVEVKLAVPTSWSSNDWSSHTSWGTKNTTAWSTGAVGPTGTGASPPTWTTSTSPVPVASGAASRFGLEALGVAAVAGLAGLAAL